MTDDDEDDDESDRHLEARDGRYSCLKYFCFISTKDLNATDCEKLGKGLRQLKHKVLGLPIFDIADTCNEDENSPNHDETLTSMSNRGSLDHHLL